VEDIIELKNGGFLRGKVVELAPGHFVSIQIAGGEVRRVLLSDIKSATRGGQPLELVTASGEQPRATVILQDQGRAVELRAELETIPGARVNLRLTADRRSILQRRLGPDLGEDLSAYWVTCHLPCQIRLPADDPQPYRVGADRVQPTPWFQLPKQDSEIRVRLVSVMWDLWPRATLIGGIVAGALGGTMWLISREIPTPEHDNWHAVFKWGGISLGGLGAVMLVSSPILLLAKPESSVEVVPWAGPR
jgi:hypothetical protein